MERKPVSPKTAQKNRHDHGQAMVEFAMVIVLLLMVVMGLFEAGRAIFLYAAINNASREATRYGSAVGLNDAGNLKYKDCQAIRDVAKQVGFLLDLEDADITISYETASHGSPVCDAASGEDSDVTLDSGDRITVILTYAYTPIVSIVPMQPRNFDSASTRTVLGVVDLP